MEQTHKPFTYDTSNRLAVFITKTKYIFIVLSLLIVIGAGAYIAYYQISNSRNLATLELLEASDEEYNDIFSEVSFYNELDDTQQERAKQLITEFEAITIKYKNTFGVQDAYYRMARLYVLLSDYENAQAQFTNALQVGKKKSFLNPKILANLASLAEQQNNLEEAQGYYLQITDNYPKSIETAHALFNLGRLSEIKDKDSGAGSSTAQGYYLTLLQDETWKESDWANLAKSRLASLGYRNYENEANTPAQ